MESSYTHSEQSGLEEWRRLQPLKLDSLFVLAYDKTSDWVTPAASRRGKSYKSLFSVHQLIQHSYMQPNNWSKCNSPALDLSPSHLRPLDHVLTDQLCGDLFDVKLVVLMLWCLWVVFPCQPVKSETAWRRGWCRVEFHERNGSRCWLFMCTFA